MEFNIMTECTSCNERKLCNEIPVEYEGKQRVMNFCKECEQKNEVECPYCYAVYHIDKCGTSFVCGSCESALEVEFDKDGNPYIESY